VQAFAYAQARMRIQGLEDSDVDNAA
jgi:hypothetical protein